MTPTDDLLWSVFIKELLFTGIYSPSFFFYFSAGEFRTGQIPYRNVPYYLSFKTSVPGRIKDGAHPLASEKG